jgi:hypothetical protein
MPSGEFEFEYEYEYDFWNVPPPSLRVNPWLRYFVAMVIHFECFPTGSEHNIVSDAANAEFRSKRRRSCGN